jgi:hypothetical protein
MLFMKRTTSADAFPLDGLCNAACSTPKIEDYLKSGWKIDTNQPTRFIPNISDDWAQYMAKSEHNRTGYTDIKWVLKKYCTCHGTKYVLSKTEKKVVVDPPPDNTVELLKEIELLMKKEIELLKKEIDMLKKENEGLKKENDTLKAKGKKNKK